MATDAGDRDQVLEALLGSGEDLNEAIAAYEPLEASYRAATVPPMTIREATDTSSFPVASAITTASAR